MPDARKQLVVNADDLGMTPGVNRAIVEAHRNGIVTSVSLLANGAAFEDAVAALRQCPRLSVGLHVNLTEGKPAGPAAKPLVDHSGCFHSPGALAIRLSVGAITMSDLEAEISAQAQRATRAGITLSHFDSHHNIHLHPRAASALASVAERMNVPWIRFRGQRPVLPWMLREAGLLRLRDHARHLVAMLGARATASSEDGRHPPRWIVGAPQLLSASPRQLFGALVRSFEEGITEWVCHPGYADNDLRAILPAAAAERREVELRVLTDPECRATLKAAGIELTSYAQLAA
jgi:chitin disaccharide deacetylase